MEPLGCYKTPNAPNIGGVGCDSPQHPPQGREGTGGTAGFGSAIAMPVHPPTPSRQARLQTCTPTSVPGGGTRAPTGRQVSQDPPRTAAPPLTCRTKLLEVVSDEVLPSERLKRLLRLLYLP